MTGNKFTKQIFTVISNLDLYDYYSHGKLHTKDGSRMPFIVWPNETPCQLANLYMLDLRNRPGRGGRQGLSRRGSKGGTMGNYASKLSQLVRFCYFNRWDFIELNDDKFSLFINSIRAERAKYNPEAKRKNEQTTTEVGRVSLDFLHFVGMFFGDKNYVAKEGTIRAQRKEFEIKFSEGKGKKIISYWHHHSFSSGDRLLSRNPITEENIKRLREATNNIDSSRFIMLRRQLLISSLECTGARVGELAELRIDDVKKADRMKEPMLRIPTLKQGDNAYRFIPVSRMFLADLKTYIRVQRQKIIRNTIGLKKDHGYLFVSETSGKQLKSSTLSEEIYRIGKAANISEQACAHMFRHAFITNLFVLLIKRHHIENENDFRVKLLSHKTLKAEVMQWTGHKNEDSLDQYIKPAFAKVANYTTTVSSVYFIRVLNDFDRRSDELIAKLKEGMPVAQFDEEMINLKFLRDKDFEIAKHRDSEQFNKKNTNANKHKYTN